MKEDSPVLYPNEKVGERVCSYAKAHTTGIPQYIHEYHEHIRQTMPETSMYMVSLSQAQALSFLTRTFGATRILEVGVYVGLSCLVWSHAVGPEGKITGLEFDSAFADQARETLQKYGVDNVEVITGDALQTLPALAPSEPYDMVFIDAQKSGYPHYLKQILEGSKPGAPNRILRKGGLIVADNILRCGFVADDSEDNPWRKHDFGPHRPEYWKSDDIKALKAYNELATAEERLENWLCPLWDGVSMSRLLD
ncbi:S-adenosyl-L-methionine-dependent methyltransferase [Stachybotrys elegans]|uniref:S-adenosyl-L-methionine-dependent methyltransferase n=1 Tax=Stachybotrys elegans TaxID=80388 RepID=A0A8K0T0H2_9HYPO|nr:S-adenosyl-L-methionine-dependent methyltransferase [Stachybotrys elegans]